MKISLTADCRGLYERRPDVDGLSPLTWSSSPVSIVTLDWTAGHGLDWAGQNIK